MPGRPSLRELGCLGALRIDREAAGTVCRQPSSRPRRGVASESPRGDAQDPAAVFALDPLAELDAVSVGVLDFYGVLCAHIATRPAVSAIPAGALHHACNVRSRTMGDRHRSGATGDRGGRASQYGADRLPTDPSAQPRGLCNIAILRIPTQSPRGTAAAITLRELHLLEYADEPNEPSLPSLLSSPSLHTGTRLTKPPTRRALHLLPSADS